MAERFQFDVARQYSRSEREGILRPWQKDQFAHLVVERSGLDALTRVLGFFKHTPESFFLLDSLTRSRANLPDPVAIVLFPRDYHLAGHFLQLRGPRGDVKSTFCSYHPGDPPVDYPPVSVIYLPDWEIFAELSAKSPLLAGAWDLVAEADRTYRWLVLADLLPEPWASETEASDKTRFRHVFDAQQR